MIGTFHVNDSDMMENIKLVKEFRNNSNKFIIATGNNYSSFKKVIDKNEIPYDYLILDQGSCIINKDEKVIKTTFIDIFTVKKIVNYINSYKEHIDMIKICNWDNEITEKVSNDDRKIVAKTYNCNSNNGITKIGVYFKNIEYARKFNSMILEKYKDVVNSYTMVFPEIIIVEIISIKTNKLTAIKVIQKIENIKSEDIYTIGDGQNDIDMITYFNNKIDGKIHNGGYCMKSSVNELLKVCKNQVNSESELIKIINKEDRNE